MSHIPEIIAFVFARGGSTGIPDKNLQLLGDLSLIGHSIQVALETEGVSKVIVSTDSEAIAEEARRSGAEVPFLRPAELASNKAPEWHAWQHAVSHPEVGSFDIFLSVPPTAPLRSSMDLSCSLARFQEGDVDIVVTGSESTRSPYFNLVKKTGKGHIDVFARAPGGVARRQDAPATFDLTTVAYVSSPQHILASDGVFDGRVGLVCIPRARALDIDEPIDLEMARIFHGKPELLTGTPFKI